jgi:hypothetical protein
LFDILKAAPVARMGYHQWVHLQQSHETQSLHISSWTHVTSKFDMHNPMMPDDTVSAGVLGGEVGDDEPVKDSEENGVLRRIASIGTEYTTDHV